MDNELRKTETSEGSNRGDLTTSDLANSIQKRPETTVAESQSSKAQPGDNRSSQYGTATAPAREKKSHRYLLLMNHRTCAPVGTFAVVLGAVDWILPPVITMVWSSRAAAPVPSITRTCSRMTLGVPTRTYLRTSGERASKRWAHASGDNKRPSRQERSSEVAI